MSTTQSTAGVLPAEGLYCPAVSSQTSSAERVGDRPRLKRAGIIVAAVLAGGAIAAGFVVPAQAEVVQLKAHIGQQQKTLSERRAAAAQQLSDVSRLHGDVGQLDGKLASTDGFLR